MAFVSSNNSGSTNEVVNTTHGVSAARTQANAANPTNVDNLNDVVICAFIASQQSSPQLGKKVLEEHWKEVSPPYTGNFMSPTPDLSFTGLEKFTSEPVVIKHVVENSEAKEEDVPQANIEKKTVKPSFAKIEFVKPKGKTARKIAK
ncbi:hypothetical protein Tco_1160018 [Tanacetum coccineum]